jgi:hypothetical protein
MRTVGQVSRWHLVTWLTVRIPRRPTKQPKNAIRYELHAARVEQGGLVGLLLGLRARNELRSNDERALESVTQDPLRMKSNNR